MAFEVVDAERRPVERRRERARDPGADEERAGEAGAARVGDDVDLVDRDAAIGQDDSHQRHDTADVVARRELGDDAAVVGVHLDLAVQRLRKEGRRSARSRANERDAGLVARRLDAENVHSGHRWARSSSLPRFRAAA